MERRVLADKRFCFKCNSDTYIDPTGRSRWHISNGQWLCKKCYTKSYNKQNPDILRIANARNNKRKCGRWQGYKGKRQVYHYDIRCGVCNWCRAVKGIDTKYTNLHHDENRYDDGDHLKFTLELCVECHAKEGIRLRTLEGRRPHFRGVSQQGTNY